MRLALATRSWTWMKMMVRDICSKLWSDRTYFLMPVFSYNTYENLYHFLPIFLCALLYPWDCSIGSFLIWPKCGCSRAKHPSGGGSAQQSLCLPDSTPWELYATTLQGRPRRRKGISMCRNFSIRLEFHLYPHRLQEASKCWSLTIEIRLLWFHNRRIHKQTALRRVILLSLDS